MSDDVQRSLGKIEGTLETVARGVSVIEKKVHAMSISSATTQQSVGDHKTKIDRMQIDVDSLKTSRSRLTGMAVASGAFFAATFKGITWLFNKTGGM